MSRFWHIVEAANPLQPSQLTLGYYSRKARKKELYSLQPCQVACLGYSSKQIRENAPDLRWHLRDARILLKLTLDSEAVAQFLEMMPQLTGLQFLRLSSLEYNIEQAGQLLEIRQLCNLKVCPYLSKPSHASPESIGKQASIHKVHKLD